MPPLCQSCGFDRRREVQIIRYSPLPACRLSGNIFTGVLPLQGLRLLLQAPRLPYPPCLTISVGCPRQSRRLRCSPAMTFSPQYALLLRLCGTLSLSCSTRYVLQTCKLRRILPAADSIRHASPQSAAGMPVSTAITPLHPKCLPALLHT